MFTGLLSELLFSNVQPDKQHDVLFGALKFAEIVVRRILHDFRNLLDQIARVSVHDNWHVDAVTTDVDVLRL